MLNRTEVSVSSLHLSVGRGDFGCFVGSEPLGVFALSFPQQPFDVCDLFNFIQTAWLMFRQWGLSYYGLKLSWLSVCAFLYVCGWTNPLLSEEKPLFMCICVFLHTYIAFYLGLLFRL